MFNKFAVIAFFTVAMPALANAAPQTQDEWFVNSGRYINSQVPSYDQTPTVHRVLDYAAMRLPTQLIERRSSAIIEWAPRGFSTDRDSMVSAVGQ